jgi:hypothetical protein
MPPDPGCARRSRALCLGFAPQPRWPWPASSQRWGRSAPSAFASRKTQASPTSERLRLLRADPRLRGLYRRPREGRRLARRPGPAALNHALPPTRSRFVAARGRGPAWQRGDLLEAFLRDLPRRHDHCPGAVPACRSAAPGRRDGLPRGADALSCAHLTHARCERLPQRFDVSTYSRPAARPLAQIRPEPAVVPKRTLAQQDDLIPIYGRCSTTGRTRRAPLGARDVRAGVAGERGRATRIRGYFAGSCARNRALGEVHRHSTTGEYIVRKAQRHTAGDRAHCARASLPTHLLMATPLPLPPQER